MPRISASSAAVSKAALIYARVTRADARPRTREKRRFLRPSIDGLLIARFAPRRGGQTGGRAGEGGGLARARAAGPGARPGSFVRFARIEINWPIGSSFSRSLSIIGRRAPLTSG